MKIDNIDIDKTLADAQKLLEEEKHLSPALRSVISVLLLLVQILSNRIGLDSTNSSKPPSTDTKKKPKPRKPSSNKKPGGQPGRKGNTLKQTEEPDEIKELKIDRRTLPKGDYEEAEAERRQVFDIQICRWVTEYQAQVLIDKNTGHRYVATFPNEVDKSVQYGKQFKAHAVYMSQYQLIPYNRVQEFFTDQMGIPVSEGSLYNFNVEAHEKLKGFEGIATQKLTDAPLLHVDETGINIAGDRHWLHCASNDQWTHFYVHKKRGSEATDAEGILPAFKGVLCHDHWKPYYRYSDCQHALCNAHHLRELTRAWEQDKQQWAKAMQEFLEACNKAVHQANGKLDARDAEKQWQTYRAILEDAQVECPPPDEKNRNGKRGRLKRSKSRNLLERFIKFEDDVLRFMENEIVPFTNNQGERDIRMTKVHQKISGCFRSMKGAKMFCRIRSYLSTCRKRGVTSSDALDFLFNDKLPEFCFSQVRYAE